MGAGEGIAYAAAGLTVGYLLTRGQDGESGGGGILPRLPNITVAPPNITLPKIEAPDVTVAPPTIKLPKIEAPTIKLPKIEAPNVNVSVDRPRDAAKQATDAVRDTGQKVADAITGGRGPVGPAPPPLPDPREAGVSGVLRWPGKSPADRIKDRQSSGGGVVDQARDAGEKVAGAVGEQVTDAAKDAGEQVTDATKGAAEWMTGSAVHAASGVDRAVDRTREAAGETVERARKAAEDAAEKVKEAADPFGGVKDALGAVGDFFGGLWPPRDRVRGLGDLFPQTSGRNF